jgi:hypothetical protein
LFEWDGSAWEALGEEGNGMNDAVFSTTLDDSGNLYVGGEFTYAGGDWTNHIARWNGSNWSPLGDGVDGEEWPNVQALVVDNEGNLYAGGSFTSAGGNPANYVARWDGNNWSPLGSGMNDWVNALALDQDGNLYAGGRFTTAGGVAANHIASWDGQSWSALGSGISGEVDALALDQTGNLFAGGWFATAGGVSANRIARWNGTAWFPLGLGMNDGVRDLVLDKNGYLFVGGEFTTAGGTPAMHIALWDGSAWSPLGAGTDDYIYSLALDKDGNLFAGGDYHNAGEAAAPGIARWDGSTWSPLGSGVDYGVYTMVVEKEGDLFAGGSFSIAGDKPSGYIAHWVNTAPSTIPDSFAVNEDSQDNLLDVLANDGDQENDPLEISTAGAPDQGGSAVHDGGMITYSPAGDFSGLETFTYTVSDGLGGMATETITVTVAGVNDAPVLGPIGAQSVTAGHELSLQITAGDVDLPAQVLAFSLVDAPEGAAITAEGLFTWTPSAAQGPGEYQVTVMVTDDGAPPESDSQTFTITVIQAEHKVYLPVIP